MDLLVEIKAKVASRSDWKAAPGIESVITHIEVAERYQSRAKTERDEHLYTDVVYRTNHAYEGILKEAYVVLKSESADRKTPYEIEGYFLSSSKLRPRVVDLLKNYRQNWRNPSTHDYQLFFSDQESYLAIVTVSAFVSILLDQMLDHLAYLDEARALETAAKLAHVEIKGFESMAPVDKAYRLAFSFCDHYIKNLGQMSALGSAAATAQLAAFIERVAPDVQVEQFASSVVDGRRFEFDLRLTVDGTQVLIETKSPRSHDMFEGDFQTDSALRQLEAYLRATGLTDGVLIHFPGRSDETALAITGSSRWPQDLNLRVIYGADSSELPDDDSTEPPVSLVDERA